MEKTGRMRARIVQLALSVILSIASAMASFANVWPSYAIPMLKGDRSALGYSISDHEANIISSLPMMGSFISTLLTGYVAEAVGRKKTQILCGLINLTGWCLITTAHTVIHTVIGRFIIGLSTGMSIVSILIYISEITELSIRGSCTTIAALLFNVGILVSYLEGWFFSYEMISYINVTVAVGFTIAMCFMKETPAYLLRMGQEKEALSSLKFYRGVTNTTEAVLEELAYLKSQVRTEAVECSEKPILEKEKSMEEKQENSESSKSNNPFILLLRVDSHRRAILTIIMFTIVSILMGMVAVQTYANQLFTQAVPAMPPDLCSVLLALVFIFTSLLTVGVTDLVPRRFLMISTCITSSVCLGVIGAALRWSWVPVWVAPVAIIVYCIAFHLGVANTVFIQLTESFGPQVISAATPIALSFMFISNFVVLYLFGPIVSHFGIDSAFFIFAIDAALATLLSAVFMKETLRVPLEDIQKMYLKGYLCRNIR